MTDSKSNRLFQLFLHSDLKYRAVWKENRIVAIEVCRNFRRPREINNLNPILSEEQRKAIADVLGEEEPMNLGEEDLTATDEVWGLNFTLPTIRFTKRK
ncbi:MAG: hypothetical protein U9Q03_03490 [Patescibacteria group bacterium]|nr:hypothetical protein [Patescibacteria group bacterium]